MTADATPRHPCILRDLLACAFCDKGVATTGLIFRQRLLTRRADRQQNARTHAGGILRPVVEAKRKGEPSPILAGQNRGVAEKIGMQFERKTVFKGFPALVFAISREQWLANRAA